MGPDPHTFRSLDIPREIIDEDAVVRRTAELCQYPTERLDLPLRLPQSEREEPVFEELEERMGYLDILPPFPRLIWEQHKAMPPQRHEQLRHAWHRLPESVPHPSA
jgi:hypothetical protein